jgi:hypothetical protein
MRQMYIINYIATIKQDKKYVKADFWHSETVPLCHGKNVSQKSRISQIKRLRFDFPFGRRPLVL